MDAIKLLYYCYGTLSSASCVLQLVHSDMLALVKHLVRVALFPNSFCALGVRNSTDFQRPPCLFLQLARSAAVVPTYDVSDCIELHEHELPFHLLLSGISILDSLNLLWHGNFGSISEDASTASLTASLSRL